MTRQTLANVFSGPELDRATRNFFSDVDMQETAKLANAEAGEGTRKLVDSLMSTAKDRILDVSLIDIMLGGWVKIAAIQEFAIGEKLLSEKTHKFEFSEHKIDSKHSPKIELYVYEDKVADLTVDITLTLIIAKTVLRIRKGLITEVRISGCKAKGKIGFHGQTLLEKESKELEFPRGIKLGDGIVIPPPLELKM